MVLCAASGIAQQPQHLFFRVTLGPQFTAPTSGRMLIFLTAGSGAKKVDENPFSPTSVYIAAKEVPNLAPGASVDVDTDDIAFPEGFSSLKPGDYQAQAVLDVGHTYAYAGRDGWRLGQRSGAAGGVQSWRRPRAGVGAECHVPEARRRSSRPGLSPTRTLRT